MNSRRRLLQTLTHLSAATGKPLASTTITTSRLNSSQATKSTMSTRTSTIQAGTLSASPVTVNFPPESAHSASISDQELLGFPAFKIWMSTLQKSLSLQHDRPDHEFHKDPYALKSITVQTVDRFGGGRIGFIKIKADVSNGAGERLPGIAVLRGGSVAMLVILQPDDVPVGSETDKHVLLTVQPRVPAGTLAMIELPAGMIDDAGSFSGAAASEIEEEIGLKIPADQLSDLTDLALPDTDDGLQKGVYTSSGGQDEFMPVFLHQRRVKRSELKEWQGRLTGLRDHGEKITLKCVPLDRLWKEASRDAKALIALSLYDGLRREGRISLR